MGQCQFRAYIGNTRGTDFVFADDAVLLPEPLEILVSVFEALCEDTRNLRLLRQQTGIKHYSRSMYVARTLRS